MAWNEAGVDGFLAEQPFCEGVDHLMANMFPNRFEDETLSEAERRFYAACAEQLDDHWDVFHSVAWLGKNEKGHRDGEADFVVAHPDWGALVVEVKGGGISFESQSGKWSSRDRYEKTHVIKDPFDQARQSKHQLVNKITSANGNLRGQFFMGHAVCFPDVNKRLEHLRPDSDPSLILDQADLGQLPDRLCKALTFWDPKKTKPKLGPMGIRAIRNTLAKDFFLPERLANIIAANEPQILRLTEEQVYILDVLSGTPRARIIGGAGTGKTMLALEKARRLGAEGKKTLLTCYNVALENHLKRIAGGMEGVQVMRFHELCVWAARQCGLPVRVLAPQENDARYWKEELPQVLEQALASSRLEKFDALVVDEGQDLSDTFWYPLLLALKEPDKSTLYVFRDDQQQLYGQGGDLISELPSFPLSQNLRNSQAIYQLASQFEQQLPSTAKGPQGKPVEWVVLEDKGRLMDTLTEVVARLIRQDQLQPEQIALLTGRRPDHYGIDGSTMLGKVPLAPSESPRKGHLTFSTIHRFKGLEAPVIILTGLGDIYQNKESMLYVALTRARHHLVIVDTPEILSKLNPSKR